MRLLDIGKRQGNVTIAELDRLLPIGSVDIRDADKVLDTLRTRGISIVLARSSAANGDFNLLNDEQVIYPR
ncbi:RNA polymerase sigma factor region1.1 domain-containing protein [Skermanella sp. TT6]|uniref:RNA polymerase sigma factor region1.1 domain-containing protein n=1 Tax=Skermanella cutis TaxID=2775420 RepID=A0ABX7B8W5_9PROT|nr:RNA polymerase sigma factor region1.1 domain-containing protein [Skermanella sp. TT6]QQP90816.2 RNA polymerase sigma factor region1.1 domain-containing protein [Skermanella sp. TT6]